MTRVQRLVRDQIIGAIESDLDGRGESLMKECYEQLEDEGEDQECYAEMRAIIAWLRRDHEVKP